MISNSDVIEELLVEWREKGPPKDVIERIIEADVLENKANIIVGPRRAGKTYYMFQLMKKFNRDKIFYINMEDERIIKPDIEHLTSIVPSIKKMFSTKGKIYLFVDEVQSVSNWEKWARRIIESPDIVLFLSGSSSKLLGKEIATSLRGRANITHVFPLNFEEFLFFRKFDYSRKTIGRSPKKPELLKLLNEYIEFGGYPEIVLNNDERIKLKLLNDYFSTIIARDIAERFAIKNIVILEMFIKYIVNNFSRYISYSKTANWFKSMGIKVGKATLIEYYGYIAQTFFVKSTSIFSYKIKDILQYPIKIYAVDNGFIKTLAIKQENKGWIYENLVANELFKEAVSNPNIEIYYWRNHQHQEIDFVLKHGLKPKQLIQVCCNTKNKETRDREINALLKASNELKCRNLLIITDSEEAEEKIKGKTIIFKPLWKWLLKID